MEFYIPETGETIPAVHRPVVIITSNAEKELPDAFLRRCVFHYIEFPGPEHDAADRSGAPPRAGRAPARDGHAGLLLAARRARHPEEALHQRADRLGAGARRGWRDPGQMVTKLPFLGVLLKKDKDVDAALLALSTREARPLGARIAGPDAPADNGGASPGPPAQG